MRNKLELTEELVSFLPDDNIITTEQAMVTWWFNLRDSGGLRLTNTGYTALKTYIKLDSWRFDINRPRAWKTPNT